MRPLGPLAVRRGLDTPLAWLERDREVVLGDEGEGAGAEAGVDFAEHGVLLVDVQGDGHGREVGFGGGEGGGGGAGEVLGGPVELVTVRTFLCVVRFLRGRAVAGDGLGFGGFSAAGSGSGSALTAVGFGEGE